AADVPQLDEAGGFGHALRLQGGIDVVALRPAAGARTEYRAFELIAARLRHDVQDRPARFSVAEIARDRDLHFLRVGDVVRVPRHAAAVERGPDVQAVELHGAFVAGASVRGEEARVHRRRRACACALQRRNRGEDRAVTTSDGELVDHLVLEHRLALAALDIDHWHFAGDLDRLRDVADLQVGVDRDGAAAGDLYTLTLHG